MASLAAVHSSIQLIVVTLVGHAGRATILEWARNSVAVSRAYCLTFIPEFCLSQLPHQLIGLLRHGPCDAMPQVLFPPRTPAQLVVKMRHLYYIFRGSDLNAMAMAASDGTECTPPTLARPQTAYRPSVMHHERVHDA